jgi:hypothetical protein
MLGVREGVLRVRPFLSAAVQKVQERLLHFPQYRLRRYYGVCKLRRPSPAALQEEKADDD